MVYFELVIENGKVIWLLIKRVTRWPYLIRDNNDANDVCVVLVYITIMKHLLIPLFLNEIRLINSIIILYNVLHPIL